MATVKEVIERLQGYSPDDHVAVDIWNEQDVIDRAKERDLVVTAEQSNKILDLMDQNQDANSGISWDTLDYWTDQVVVDKHDKSIPVEVKTTTESLKAG